MKYILIMAICDSFQTLRYQVSDSILANSARPITPICSHSLVFPDQVKDSTFDELKYQVEIVADPNNLLELNDVLMV